MTKTWGGVPPPKPLPLSLKRIQEPAHLKALQIAAREGGPALIPGEDAS